jgi:hypothetical protein
LIQKERDVGQRHNLLRDGQMLDTDLIVDSQDQRKQPGRMSVSTLSCTHVKSVILDKKWNRAFLSRIRCADGRTNRRETGKINLKRNGVWLLSS